MKWLLPALLLPLCVQAKETGPDPGYAGAPPTTLEGVTHPMSCASGMCHSNDQNPNNVGGPINAFSGHVMALFSNGSSYTPGGPPITITVSVSDPVNTHYGFEMTARLESDLANGQAGSFTVGTTASCPASAAPCEIVICDDGAPRFKTCSPGALVQYIEHAYPLNSQVSTTPYMFTWTPPATNVGRVHFFVAGNAVNGDLTANGKDHVYTAEYVLTPALCSGATPAIQGIVSATDFGQLPNIASSSWVEIYGSHFASDVWQWNGLDFINGNAPTNTAGVTVSVNSHPAYVWFVSSGQINALIPDDVTTGPVSVTVSSCANTSAPFTAQKTALAPGLLAPAWLKVNGTQYLEAIFGDLARVGNPNLVPNIGLTFRPAKPGDVVVVYGIGFGDATGQDGSGAVPLGALVGPLNDLNNPVRINFGDTPANVAYAGLTPGYVGLYQFTLFIPDVPDGDVPINVTQNGVPISQKLFLTVHH